jgi:hypothetical protein
MTEIKKIDEQLTQSIDDFIGKLVVEMVQTPTFNRIAKSILNRAIQQWSKGKYLRGKIAGPAEKIISVLFLGSTGAKESKLFDDTSTVKLIANLSPSLINGFFELMAKINELSNKLPAEVRAEYLASIIKGIDTKQIGHFFTDGLSSINELAKIRPAFLADAMKVPVKNLIESTDFGELREAVDGLEDFIPSFLKIVNDEIWNYPAKVVNILGCVPGFVNGVTRGINEVVRPLNNLAPEILADVTFSILRSVNGKGIGMLANSIMELSRKMHTGSLLLADSSQSQFYIDSKSLLQDVVSTINPELFCKFQIAMSEVMETITKSYTDAVSQNPKIYTTIVSSYSDRKNPGIRSTKLKLSMYENVSEEEAANAVSKGLSDLDTREIGETINIMIRYIKLIHKYKPEMIPHILSEIALSIDTEELKSAADSMIGDIANALKPSLRALLPSLFKGLTSLLTPDEDEESNDLNEAVSSLIKVFVHRQE